LKLAVDSSAFAKRYVKEVGSEKLDRLLQNANDLGLCVITLPEIISALNRRWREGSLNDKDYEKAKNELLNDADDATVLQITPSVTSQAVKLLESNALRAMDTLHIACALEWNAHLFVTADRRQFKAGMNSGLQVQFLGDSEV
jgi:predicted nucleic acid-binding protein